MKATTTDKSIMFNLAYPVPETQLMAITNTCIIHGAIVIDDEVTISRDIFLEHHVMMESSTYVKLAGAAMAGDEDKFTAAKELFRKLLQSYIEREINARL